MSTENDEPHPTASCANCPHTWNHHVGRSNETSPFSSQACTVSGCGCNQFVYKKALDSYAGRLDDAFKDVDVDTYIEEERKSWEDDDT